MSTVTLVVGILLVGAGAWGCFAGYKRWEVARVVSETPTSDVRQLDSEGLVELKGRVVPEETFDSPIGQVRDTVLAAWEVEEWEERGDTSSWKTLASGVESTPFSLDDGTDEVLVDPGNHVVGEGTFFARERFADAAAEGVEVDGVTCEFRRFPVTEEVGAEEPGPEHIRRFVAGERGLSRQSSSITNVVDIGNAHGDRRYYEGQIRDGEEVYVLGHATPKPDATRPLKPEDLVVRPPPEGHDDDLFVVSELKEEQLIARGKTGRIYLAAGLVAIAAGAYLLGGGVP